MKIAARNSPMLQPAATRRFLNPMRCNSNCEQAQPAGIKKAKEGETGVTAVLNALCAPTLCGRIPRLKRNRFLWMR
jgi:hypothetical protein